MKSPEIQSYKTDQTKPPIYQPMELNPFKPLARSPTNDVTRSPSGSDVIRGQHRRHGRLLTTRPGISKGRSLIFPINRGRDRELKERWVPPRAPGRSHSSTMTRLASSRWEKGERERGAGTGFLEIYMFYFVRVNDKTFYRLEKDTLINIAHKSVSW